MKHLVTLLAAAVTAGITLPAAAQLTLSLNPVSQQNGVGGMITYNIDINGLKSNPDLNGPALGAFNVMLDYNASLASVQSVNFGALLSNSGPDSQMSDISTPGQIFLMEISFDSPAQLEAAQSGSFVLGSFTLEGLAAGSAPITFDLANTSLSDENGNSLTLAGVNNGTITVVPEPGVCALASLGVAALVFQARRRTRRLN